MLDAAYLSGFAAVIIRASPAQAPGLVVTEALIERFGALTIIVLGETLTGVVTGLVSAPVSGLTLAVGLVAVVVGFGAWWTYFDFAGQRPPRTEPAASAQWMLGRWLPPAPPWPWRASASGPCGRRRSFWDSRSCSCWPSRGCSPSRAAWTAQPALPLSKPLIAPANGARCGWPAKSQPHPFGIILCLMGVGGEADRGEQPGAAGA